MAEQKCYAHLDDSGVYRVGGTRVSLDSVVIAYKHGHSAEAIQEQYGDLSLEQVYGAITYFLANRQDVEAYLEQQELIWRQIRQEIESVPSPVVQRLRALKRAGAANLP